MFTWLKNLFNKDITTNILLDFPDNPIINSPVESVVEQAEPVAKPKKQAKKPATKKVVTVDLDSMSKKDLLAHAKQNGVKANASMNKADILAAINKG